MTLRAAMDRDWPDVRTRAAVLMLATVIASGVVLRFVDLSHLVFWHDEVHTALRVLGFTQREPETRIFSGDLLTRDDLQAFQRPRPDKTFADTWHSLSKHPEHPPLYYLLAWALVQTGIAPVTALRGTSAVLSLLLLPGVFWLAREALGCRATAWAAVLLVSVSPLHLLYAQEARQYALWVSLAALSSAALLHALRRRTPGAWGLYAALATLGLYSHLLFVHVLLAHSILVLAMARHDLGNRLRHGLYFGTSLLVALLAFLPWARLLMLREMEVRRATDWLVQGGKDTDLLHTWLSHASRLFFDMPGEQGIGYLFGLGALTAVVLLLTRGPRPARWLVVALTLPALTLMAVPDALFGGVRSTEPRYLLPTLLGLELAVAWALAQAGSSRRRLHRHAALAGLAAVLLGGLGSDIEILRADSWWTKGLSAHNAELARRINAAPRPLVLVSASRAGITAPELISLSYGLRDDVPILTPAKGASLSKLWAGATVLLLTPSKDLLARLSRTHHIEAFRQSPYWLEAIPLGPDHVTGPSAHTTASHIGRIDITAPSMPSPVPAPAIVRGMHAISPR
jgi:uncharacterized membrane protein